SWWFYCNLSCLVVLLVFFFSFFFSSRRRHTRSKRDWSSDVCSSDLEPIPLVVLEAKAKAYLNRCRISASNLYRANLMIMKDGTTASSKFGEETTDRDFDEASDHHPEQSQPPGVLQGPADQTSRPLRRQRMLPHDQ